MEISIVVPSGVNPDAESSHSKTELKCKNGNVISFTFPTAIGLFDDKYQYMQGGWSESKIAAFQQSIKNRFGTAENIEKQGKREVQVKVPYQLEISPESADFKFDPDSKLFTVWATFKVQEDARFEKIKWGVRHAQERETEKQKVRETETANAEAFRQRVYREAKEAFDTSQNEIREQARQAAEAEAANYREQARVAAEAAIAQAAEAEAQARAREAEAQARLEELERRMNSGAAGVQVVHHSCYEAPTDQKKTSVPVARAVGPVVDPILLKLLETQMGLLHHTQAVVSPSKRHAEFQFTDEGGMPSPPKVARHGDGDSTELDDISEYFSVGNGLL